MKSVRKVKAIFHTLNLFNLDVTQKCLIAECWVPVRDLHIARKALAQGTVYDSEDRLRLPQKLVPALVTGRFGHRHQLHHKPLG